jgi:hypothetical protein
LQLPEQAVRPVLRRLVEQNGSAGHLLFDAPLLNTVPVHLSITSFCGARVTFSDKAGDMMMKPMPELNGSSGRHSEF